MKVLQINVTFNRGSTGKIANDLHTALLEDGHESRICYGRGKKTRNSNTYKFASNFSILVDGFLTRITGLVGYFSIFSTIKLIRYISRFKPDVVHLHNLHGYYVNFYMLVNYLKKSNIKTIWTLHDEFLYTGRCGCSYSCEKWKNGCNKCELIKDYPKSLFFDLSSKMFNDKMKILKNFNNLMLVTPSEWLKNRVLLSHLKDNKIRVINNGIDIKNVFHPKHFEELKEKHGIEKEKIVLAIAPDFSNEHKGGKYVLALARMLRYDNIKIIMIGVTDNKMHFDENIIPVSRIENQNILAQYYSMADAFLICSEQETFPTVCIEAISCGTPIVGFDCGGTAETANEDMGIFVPFGDLKKLKKAVLDITHEKNVENISNFGRENYSIEKMYESYLELYRS